MPTCPLHGPTEYAGTNAAGFPVYRCCMADVAYRAVPDACTRAPSNKGTPEKRQPTNKERP